MKKINIFCLSLSNFHYQKIVDMNYIPVGLGEEKFSDKWIKDKDGKDIGEINKFEKELDDYWSKIIAGDIKLENGEIFDDTNFYNKKYLKFKPDTIAGVLIVMAITVDDEEFTQKCKDKYMQLACFEEDIEDIIRTKIKEEEPYRHEELEGSKICKKKYLKSSQWLRDQKVKNYSLLKFYKIKWNIIDNGGWHFSCLMSPKGIQNKIKSFAHDEYNKTNFIDLNKIKHSIAKGEDLFNRNQKYCKIELNNSFPKYIFNNLNKYQNWII